MKIEQYHYLNNMKSLHLYFFDLMKWGGGDAASSLWEQVNENYKTKRF